MLYIAIGLCIWFARAICTTRSAAMDIRAAISRVREREREGAREKEREKNARALINMI